MLQKGHDGKGNIPWLEKVKVHQEKVSRKTKPEN